MRATNKSYCCIVFFRANHTAPNIVSLVLLGSLPVLKIVTTCKSPRTSSVVQYRSERLYMCTHVPRLRDMLTIAAMLL
eukprot:COSAG02_NODE_26369_length_634_cov_1.734579_1_plen_77_part_01